MNHNLFFYLRRGMTDLWFILATIIAVLSCYALWRYDPAYASWSATSSETSASGFQAWCHFFADLCLSTVGYAAYLIPIGFLVLAWQSLKQRHLDAEWLLWKMFGLMIALFASASIFSLHFAEPINALAQTGGGILGQKTSIALLQFYSVRTVMLIYFLFLALSLTLLFEIHWFDASHRLGFLIWQTTLRVFAKDKQDSMQSYAKTHFESSEQKQTEMYQRLHIPLSQHPWAVNPKDYFRESASETAPEPSHEPPKAEVNEAPPEAIVLGTQNLKTEAPAEVAEESASMVFKPLQQTSASWQAYKMKQEEEALAQPETPPVVSKIKLVEPAETEEPVRVRLKSQSLNLTPPLMPRATERPAPAVAAAPSPKSNKRSALPPVHLLHDAPPQANEYSDEELDEMAKTIEEALISYRLQVAVVGISQGPVITQFELEPAAGIKSSQIANLDKDLARLLSVQSVRVVEVIPGKPYIGLEIPNRRRSVVHLRSLVESESFHQAAKPLSLILGVDVANEATVVNLEKMPHLLVAGTTGSGKSVGINVMLASLLYQARPQDLRLILIDPKMLEMSMYRDIPHLLMPVVTDMRVAEGALRWVVGEMERRYALMASEGAIGIRHYNQKVGQNEALPFIVVVIDELADLMMVAGKKVEDLIMRIAQKARAAGIHLILATQRPSVDVVTGIIKANIPTRIAFQVSSKVDSRTIIESNGAEALLGNGDMLYMPSGSPQAIRVHGAFVSSDEIAALTDYWRSQGSPQYVGETQPEAVQEPLWRDDEGENDALFGAAQALALQRGKVSAIVLQRELRIDYKRASQLLEALRRHGVIQ